MVGGSLRRFIVGRMLKVAKRVVVLLVDAGKTSDSQAAKIDDTGITHEVDVGGQPSAVRQFLQVVRSLVVAADNDGEHRRLRLAGVVLRKIAKNPILVWDRDSTEVTRISDGLERVRGRELLVII